MNNAGAIMLEFLQSSAALGKLIHQDYNSAKKIFDEIKKTTNFTALIEQQKEDSNNFLKECKSFANSVER